MRDSQAIQPRSIDGCRNYWRLTNSAMEEDKVDKGNKDQHRYTYSGGVKAQETEKWGASTARERYGRLPQVDMKRKDMRAPQFPEDKRGPDWQDDHPNDWVRGKGESAEGKPGFDHSKGGRR